jgi:hypothetical protein
MMKAGKRWFKLTMALVGALILNGVSSAQTFEVLVDDTGTAYAILGLEV